MWQYQTIQSSIFSLYQFYLNNWWYGYTEICIYGNYIYIGTWRKVLLACLCLFTLYSLRLCLSVSCKFSHCNDKFLKHFWNNWPHRNQGDHRLVSKEENVHLYNISKGGKRISVKSDTLHVYFSVLLLHLLQVNMQLDLSQLDKATFNLISNSGHYRWEKWGKENITCSNGSTEF